MKKPTGERPARRRKTTALDPPDEQNAPARETAAEKMLESSMEQTPAPPDIRPSSATEEIPLAEVLPDSTEDERQADERVDVYFRRLHEESITAAQAEETTLTRVRPSSYHDDRAATPDAMTLETGRDPGRDADAVLPHVSAVPDRLPLELAPLDLPPLPAMFFALILLALAF